jgi:UDP-N-acetyl-D-mannosaminuronate dehydrogenase
LGVAYRPGVNETCESPGLDIVGLLDDAGADVLVVDPDVTLDSADVEQVSVADVADRDLDAAVVTTDHEAFGDLGPAEFGGTIVIDGRDTIAGGDGRRTSSDGGEVPEYRVVTIGDGAADS